MAKRLDKTLADYVVSGVMPALLIGLLVSLCFFLLELAYSGQYMGQMKWILFFFIVGTVLIARISMRGDISERAGLYGVGLAIAAGMAMVRFVDIPKTSMGGFGWLIPFSLMSIIWWSAHKLTQDSTWDDEEEDDGGGLLDPAAQAVPEAAANKNKPADWFDKYQEDRQEEQRRKKPGLMVVYFSLAALPLFGVGQAMIPVSNIEGRRYAFWLLTVYVGCGLGMLLTTSFLGLRRYLRGRRLQMPATMTALWLGLGTAMILTLMLLSAVLLPRPEAEYHISQLVGWATSKERDANSTHFFEGSSGKSNDPGSGPQNARQPQENKQQQQGKNAGNQQQQQNRSGNQAKGDPGRNGQPGRTSQKDNSSSQGQGKINSNNQGGQGEGKQGSQGQRQSGQGKSGQGKSAQGKNDQQGGNQADQQTQGKSGNEKGNQPRNSKQRSDQAKAEGKQAGQEGDLSKDQQGEGEGNEKSDQQKENEKREGREGNSKQEQQNQRGEPQREQQESGTPASANQPPPPPPPPAPSPSASSPSFDWLKWLGYAIMLAGILFVAWKWGRQLWEGLKQIWQDILNWWRGLMPVARDVNATQIPDPESHLPPKPFAWFSNPLMNPGNFRSMDEMIRYSFAALHSWAYEQNLGRQPNETPTEFAQRLGQVVKHAHQDIRKLADLYSVVTYARTNPPGSSETILRNFWQRVSTT